jgi:hypothetical protein
MDAIDPRLLWAAGILALVALLVLLYVLRKGRRLPGEHVFRASRLTKGNRIFPSQVSVTAAAVTTRKPQWIGKVEESVHIAHIASIQVDTNVIFSNVMIETTGGHNPLVFSGHTKGDAIRMKKVIEGFQSEYYRKNGT